MKVLSIIAQKPMSTGSGIYLTELVRKMEEEGIEQGVIAGVYEDDIVELPEKVRFYPVYFDTPKLPFKIFGMSDEMPYESSIYKEMSKEELNKFKNEFISNIERAVKEIDPDIILCHHLYLLTAMVRERFGDRLVYGFCHNTDLRQMDKHSLEREYIIENVKKLDKIFAPQYAQAREITRIYGIEADKIELVGIGYNEEIFNEKEKVNREDNKIKLLFTGKITQKKGVKSLIRSLSYLDIDKDKLSLTLVGSAGNTEEFEEIRELANASKYEIIFTGRLNPQEVAEQYRKADIFVLPSFFDAIPLVVIEALACGLRVVVSKLDGIEEFFVENGLTSGIAYVNLPRLKNVDEPYEEDLEEFERLLAKKISDMIKTERVSQENIRELSWKKILEKVIK